MNTTEQAPGQAGPRILLVEDEPRIRDFITRALVTAGYGVAAAGNGTEGLRLALAGDYDLVILDLIMPDIDGRRSEEHTSELQSHVNLVCRLLLEKKKNAHDSSQP